MNEVNTSPENSVFTRKIEMFQEKQITVEDSYNNLIQMLELFDELEKIQTSCSSELKNKKKFKKQIEKNYNINLFHKNSVENHSPKKRLFQYKDVKDIQKVDINIILIILSMTLEEFHKSFKDFYSRFDKNSDLYLNREEFLTIIQFLMKMDSMTEEKMVKLTKHILLETNTTRSKSANGRSKITEIETSKKFTDDLFNRLFNKLMIPIMKEGRQIENLIEFLKILPFIMSFFLEHCRCKIETRKRNIQIIKGTTEKEEKDENYENKIERDQNSLIYRFELLGYNYKEYRNQKNIRYTEIEEILIRFRNSYPDSITDDQLHLVLNDLQQLLQVNRHSKLVRKKKKLKNILHWLSYKICLNCCLFSLRKENLSGVKEYKYIEENVLWSIASYGYRYSEKLGPKFLKFVEKNNYVLTLKNYKTVVHKFLKKIIPLLTDEGMNIMIDKYGLHERIVNYKSEEENLEIALNVHIHPMLLFEAKSRLKQYLHTIIIKVRKVVDNVPESPTVAKIRKSIKKSASPELSHRIMSLHPMSPMSPIQFKEETDSILQDDIHENDMNIDFQKQRLIENFESKKNREKLMKIGSGLEIMNRFTAKLSPSMNYTELKEGKLTKTVNLGTSTIISEHSFLENDSDHERSVLKGTISDSENDMEEKKSVRNSPRKIQTSINLEPTKASVFRKNRQLTVTTILTEPNQQKTSRTIKKQTTLVNNESPIVISPGKKRSKKEISELIKKSTKLAALRNKFSLAEANEFLGARFKESEINEVRPYHKMGLEINHPDLLKNKTIMQKGLSNDLKFNRTTFFSKKLQEKMNKQIIDGENEQKKGWIRCDFDYGPKNACKCLIF